MATAQQERKFKDEEAERFAALMAGFDTPNPSEAEAMEKGRSLRRMAAKKNVRVVDAFELPEIRAALDAQMKPERMEMPDVAALQAENDDLRGKLALAVPKVTELAEALEVLTREREEDARSTAQSWAWSSGISTVACAASAVFGIAQHNWLLIVLGCAGLIFGVWFLKSEI